MEYDGVDKALYPEARTTIGRGYEFQSVVCNIIHNYSYTIKFSGFKNCSTNSAVMNVKSIIHFGMFSHAYHTIDTCSMHKQST